MQEPVVPESKLPPVQRRGFKVGVTIAIVVLLVVVGTAAYIGLSVLKDEPPPPPPKTGQKKAVPGQAAPASGAGTEKKAGTTEGAKTTPKGGLGDQIAHAPKKAIDQTIEAVAAKRRVEQDRIDALASGNDAPERRAVATPPNGQPPLEGQSAAGVPAAKAAAAGAQPPPTRVVTATVEEKPQIPASAAFRQFVSEMVIRGVFQGNPPRVSINGRTFRAGEIVDKGLGVIFVGIDAEKKTITFRDATGAVITRKYM